MNDQLDLRPAPGRVAPSPPPATRRRRRRWVSPLIGLLIIAGVGLIAWRELGGGAARQAGRAPATPPQSVGIATIGTGNIKVVLTGLGTVTPLATVTVQPQVNGQLLDIPVREGQEIHKGDLLAQIDPRSYQATLDQAEGTLAHDQGLLAQATADNARYQLLNRQDSISKQQAQDQVYLVKQYQGTVAADQGTVDAAKVNLGFTKIVSPIDGRVGIRNVDPGNYVSTGSSTTGLFVLTQEHPMSVLFALPQDNVPAIQKQMAAGPLQVAVYDKTNVTLIDTGQLQAVDNQVDVTTGTVRLRALFPNASETLFPQQFVNARLLLQTLSNVVVVPQAAVQTGAPGTYVWLVKPDSTVAIQTIRIGVTDGTNTQVLDGLKAGDRIVTDGLDRLRAGQKVVVVTPQADNQQPGSASQTQTPPQRRGGGRRNGANAGGANGGAAASGSGSAARE